MSSELGTVARRYALEEMVARGGMATVWRARDEVLGRHVAVKILHAHLTEDPAFIERFRREALAAAALGHPNIVAIYDTGEEPEVDVARQRHFIVMEWCGGATLADLLSAEGALDSDRIFSVAAPICDALAYAHKNGVVHRDIKPANVLFTADGTVKVGDFGIAKAAWAGGDLTTTGSIIGTAAYLSPEQARGLEPDARSDVYSLGVVLYELATGRVPFSGETQLATALMHVNAPLPPPRGVRPGIPRSLEAAIQRALEKDPDRRYASAAELRAALEPARGARPTPVVSPPPALQAPGSEPPQPAEPVFPVGKGWGPVALLILAAVLVAVGLPRLLDEGGAGPDGGSGGKRQPGTGVLEVAEVHDFDPYGGGEHPEDARAAADGNPGTSWTSESYDDALQLLKPGLGLVFDLGTNRNLASMELSSPSPGFRFEVRGANAFGASESDFDVLAGSATGGASQEIDLSGARARFVLLWITSLPGGGGGSVSISEVRFLGS